MLKYIVTGAVLSAAFLWSFASDDRIISYIERDLTTQLNSVAPKTPNDLFDYLVAGRDVIIQIREFGREDEIDTLLQQIASVGGVDSIFLVGSVANPATAPAIAALSRSVSNKLFVEILIDNNVLTVTGNASDPKATEIVLQKLRDSKGIEVNNYLDFYPGIPSSQWLEHLKTLTSRLPTAGNLLITESGVSRYGGIFGKAKRPDSSRAPLQIAEVEATAVAEAAAEVEAAVQCNLKLKGVLGGSTISFKHDSDQPDLKSIQVLDQISKIVELCTNSVLAIGGHTDSLGPSEFNFQLSQRRANAVKSRLILNGVDASAIEAVGFGESSPIASNETRKGRAENRRIEFIFLPATQVRASSTMSPDQQ